MRRLHRRNDTEFRKPRDVVGKDDLRVFDTPARFLDFALVGGHALKRLLVKIQNLPVRAIANGMRPNLHALAQRFLKHGQEVLFLPFQEPGRVVIRIILEQRRAFRRDPSGPAPVLGFSLELRAQLFTLQRIVWGVALEAPPALSYGEGVLA